MKLKTATKEQSIANRQNTRKKIMAMPQFKSRQEFTRQDAMDQCRLKPSVATMALRMMLDDNLITMRVIDENGKMAFKATQQSILKKPWRIRNYEFESNFSPRYF